MGTGDVERGFMICNQGRRLTLSPMGWRLDRAILCMRIRRFDVVARGRGAWIER